MSVFGAEEKAEVRSLIKARNHFCDIVECTNSKVDLDQVLGINYLELLANRSRTEAPQGVDLNGQGDAVRLPYDDESFDVVSNVFSTSTWMLIKGTGFRMPLRMNRACSPCPFMKLGAGRWKKQRCRAI